MIESMAVQFSYVTFSYFQIWQMSNFADISSIYDFFIFLY